MIFCGSSSAQVTDFRFESWKASQKITLDLYEQSGDIEKVAGKNGGSAIRLTNSYDQSAYSNVALLGEFGYGFAYSQTPDSIRITYKSNLGQDTAFITLALGVGGDQDMIIYENIALHGNASNWVTRTFPLAYLHPTPGLSPDSGWIDITSTDPVFGPFSNGSIDIDQIELLNGNTVLNPLPNAHFDNWTTLSLYSPNDWLTIDDILLNQGVLTSAVTRSVNAHQGTYAIRVAGTSVESPFGPFTSAGWAVTSADKEELGGGITTPAFPVNGRYKSIRGFYITQLSAKDVATVTVNLFNSDSIVGTAQFMTGENFTGYTEFSEDITWNPNFAGIPDSASIQLMVSDSFMFGVGSLNSYAIFDDIQFSNYATLTRQVEMETLKAFPNPANEYLAIEIPASNSLGTIRLVSADGKNVVTQQVLPGDTKIEKVATAHLPQGFYVVEYRNQTGVFKKKITIAH